MAVPHSAQCLHAVSSQDTRQDNAVHLRPRCTGTRGPEAEHSCCLPWPPLAHSGLSLVSWFILSIYITFVVKIYFCRDAFIWVSETEVRSSDITFFVCFIDDSKWWLKKAVTVRGETLEGHYYFNWTKPYFWPKCSILSYLKLKIMLMAFNYYILMIHKVCNLMFLEKITSKHFL